MIEQYIYSRANVSFTNAKGKKVGLGYGFMAESDHMTLAMKDEVLEHCGEFPKITASDSSGTRLPLWRKVRLPDGRILLQMSARIEGEGRPFHTAHGYLLEEGEFIETPTESWFAQTYQLTDPNKEAGGCQLSSLEGLPAQAVKVSPLAAVMGKVGLSEKEYCRLLLACFDAVSTLRQIRVVYDFDRPDAQELQQQFLMWLYACLPCELRLELGFDSVFNERSASKQIQLVFVDGKSVQGSGMQSTIQQGSQTVHMEGSFLLRDGTLLHNYDRYPCTWCGEGSLFSRWLEKMVYYLWRLPEEQNWRKVRQEMDRIYAVFHRQLSAVPKGERLSPELYSAACWLQLLSAAGDPLKMIAEELLPVITPEEKESCAIAILTWLGDAQAQEMILEEILPRNYSLPFIPRMRGALAKVAGDGGAVGKKAGAMLGACLAWEVDHAPDVGIGKVLARYQEDMPAQTWEDMSRFVFFGELDEAGKSLWVRLGVRHDEETCLSRRCAWCREKLGACQRTRELPRYVHEQVSALAGLGERQREQMMGEMISLFRDRYERMTVPPDLQTVLKTLEAAEAYQGESLQYWASLRSMIISLADRCRLPQGGSGVKGLVEIMKAFPQDVGERELTNGVQGLFLRQCRSIREHSPVFLAEDTADGSLFSQLEWLEEQLPKEFPPELADEARESLRQMRMEACKLLLDQPREFMAHDDWLKKQTDRLPAGGGDDTGMILRVLEVFSRASEKNGALWREISAGCDEQVRDKVLHEIMPKMFLKGLLPGVSPFFVLMFLYRKPEQAEDIIWRTGEDAERQLLASTLRFARRYGLQIPDSDQSFEELILSTVCTDDRFEAKLREKCSKELRKCRAKKERG